MSAPEPPAPPARAASVDAYRGFVMFLMMAEVFRLSALAKAFPDSGFWEFLAFHQSHVPWRGCSLHDLIQPSFSFLVGVAVPFSLAARRAKGQGGPRAWLHALRRAALLVLLGVFLRSVGQKQTNWTFVDTLSQIGLGYAFLFALGHAKPVWQRVAVGGILVAYWLAFALYPLPPEGFDYAKVSDLKPHERPTGFAAHWDKNTNAGSAFETWFMNLFPREKPFGTNSGGYVTLNFVPTLATMLLGLLAGNVLRGPGTAWAKVKHFVLVGAALLAFGLALDAAGVCPSVKRIWTPAWVLFSGGCCFLLLAGFVAVLDTGAKGRWALPLLVIGANSIAAYCLAHLLPGFIRDTAKTHFGANVFAQFGPYEHLASGADVFLALWLILFWMWQRKIFVKV
jgi:heparan-alpha-glucosaminide N-acetyltransferase